MHSTLKLSALSLLVIAGHAHAAGFQLAEQSATGLGRAFAGEAAIAENASVLSRNVAAMTRFDKMAFSGGAIYVSPDVNIEGKTTGLLTHADATARDIAADAWVPNAYLIIPLNEQWRLGFSATSYYGLGVKMPDNYSAGHFGNVSDIKTMDLGTSLAYRINDMWSIGAGISAIQGEGEVGGTFPSRNLIAKHLQGDGWAWGWNVGTLLELSEQTRIGLSYRHDVTLTLSGDAIVGRPNADGSVTEIRDTGSLDLPLPATAELAAFHQLTDNLALHGSLNWTNWSKFVQLEADLNNLQGMHIKDEHWEDSWRYAIGMTYQLTPQWQLRSGVAYDASPVPADRRTISIPDADRLWYSLGMGYQFTPNLTVDLGLTLIDGKKVDVTEKMELQPGNPRTTSTFQGTSEGDAWLAGLQMSYLF
ncbi:transporter [Aeromonas jandaei]|uniref:OmpP1/FadL family transporter n=1 Tax=Aeromonas jandaei TaxID=650 RepID=UPI001C5B8A72|nr:outer membrane protein transport protein [Aeromonas jandaei]MBW3760711.1 transporter [Aeromonas jandaei]